MHNINRHVLTKDARRLKILQNFFRFEMRKLDSYKSTSVVFDFSEIKMSDKRVPGNTYWIMGNV